MPHVLPQRPREEFKLTLNSDGRPHPLENTLTVLTLACGIVAFVVGLAADAGVTMTHVVASIVGTVGTIIGLYTQLVSATTAQRWLIVIGIGGSAVGAALGLASGGFAP